MKKWILNWLGLGPNQRPVHLGSDSRSLLPEIQQRRMFEIINAQNGKILTFNEHKMNPHGPDVNNMTVYLIHDGEDIMEVINRAMIKAALV